MEKKDSLFGIALIMIVIFLIVSIITFLQSNKLIEKGYLASEGGKAQDFAELTASGFEISDARITELKQLTYEGMKNCAENKQLAEIVGNKNLVSKIDYAYIMLKLNPTEVKYRVNTSNNDIFDAPIGTPLNIMWLLDVNTDNSVGLDEDMQDIHRYSYYIDEDDKIFSQAPTYVFNSSEWGKHICGYSPIYSKEGTYIGVLGVELQTNDFDEYRNTAMIAMGALLIISNICLLAFFIVMYFRHKRQQFQRIYTDALTKISNRSYYNDQFIKKLNSERKQKTCFALMIADIDWFKKVNDTFGHEVGDQVLIEMGEILLNVFGKEYVCRFGGEEFVVGLWVKDKEEIKDKIDRLLKQVRGHAFSSQQIDVTLSLGCSYCNVSEKLGGWITSGMLKAADCKLYEVKENGRNNYRMIEYQANHIYTKGVNNEKTEK